MIVVNYGKDWVKSTYETLEASDIKVYLKPGMAVAIKPNLVLASPPENGATTHPEVLEGIICFLKDFGITKIKIMESSAVGNDTKKAYKVCGYEYLTKKYNVPLVDLKNAPHKTLNHSGLDIQIAEAAFETDFFINVPVLKAHCQTRFTCCLKNLKGCIPEKEMRRFHALGLHKPIAALASLLPVHYCVVDGICGDLSFEEGGSPVEANRIIAGRDSLLIDSFCAELIGYKPQDIGYLVHAQENGLGEFFSAKTKVMELGVDNKPAIQQKSKRLSEDYRSKNTGIAEDRACSVCYAALIFALHRNGYNPSKIEKICIGQGFKGKTDQNTSTLGIGDCARGFDNHVGGCPPKAVDIITMINTLH
ncbi:MAG: DUF362 domain-containing protein [Defluviitaleaceae bacterium]|nr:DUF362 domain-containing protein [Defluviitaleaceae bacterium]